MDVRKTIEELTSHLSEINYDSEEENLLLKDSNLDDNSQENKNVEVQPSSLRKRNHLITLPEQVYGGKTTTRKKTFSLSNEASADETDEDDLKHASDESSISDKESEEGSIASDEGGESEEVYSSGPDDSKKLSSEINKSKNDSIDYNIYSEKSKNIPSDVKKGTAIRNQLRIWDSLLECRIKLQKALSACNELPTKEKLLEEKSHLESDDKLKLNKCKRDLLMLLDKMTNLQKDLLKQCDGIKNSKGSKSIDLNEEIPSDESEIEDENKQEDDDQPPLKKQKLKDYSKLIRDRHTKFIPLRNASIQKWNDKTKVSSGKMANSNFSAFDQSTLKQIEQVMADKIRLVNRTRIKRCNMQNNATNEEVSQDAQDAGLDVEIFDDTDFYHKLLRDYIERKSVDVSNSSQTERQMIELQKLRSKMKKAVDTKSTKGRKLRYVVLPKLVNFMAPNPYCSTWSEEAETELYNSLFRKNKV